MTHPGRLPLTTRPRRYELLIAPDLDASTFSGEVVIALELTEPTDTIRLNSKGLDVALVELRQGGAPLAATLAVNEELEQLVITADRALSAGDATLELQFDGAISHGLLGFYRSTYVDEAGADRVLAATQFEAPHARKAFPCFDEPEFKATFAITLVVAEGLLALSNGPEIDRAHLPDGNVRVRFGETIPMSTYLVAWVVGPLEVTEPVDAGGVAVRVAYVPGRGHLTRSHSTSARSRSNSSPTTTASRIRARNAISSRSPTSPSAQWRTSAASRSARRACWSTPIGHARRDVGRGAHDRARDRAHVVRRPRHHEVVERHLAQRGLRHVHGAPRRRRVQAGMEDLGRVRARARGRARRRRAGAHPHRRVRGHHARGRRRHVRPPHLPKGWVGPAHARTVARRRRVPRRRTALPRPVSTCEHRDDRPLGRARRGDGPACAPDHGHLDLPTRVPRGAGGQWRDRTVALLVRRRRARREVGAARAGARAHRITVGDTFVALGCRAAAPRCPRRRVGRAQRGRRGLLPRRVPHRMARPPAGRGRVGTARTLRTRRRPVGVGTRGRRERGRLPFVCAAIRDRDRSRRVARRDRPSTGIGPARRR